jgi:hypothetical protein
MTSSLVLSILVASSSRPLSLLPDKSCALPQGAESPASPYRTTPPHLKVTAPPGALPSREGAHPHQEPPGRSPPVPPGTSPPLLGSVPPGASSSVECYNQFMRAFTPLLVLFLPFFIICQLLSPQPLRPPLSKMGGG